MTETLGTPWGVHLAGTVYEVADAIGASWRRAGLAIGSTMPPDHIAKLLARLDDGAGQPCLFLPPAGMEFGHEVMSHVRIVHFHRASEKVVCCRPGHEVLYPSAAAFVTDWTDPVPEVERVGTQRDLTLEWPAIVARFPDHHPVRAGGLTYSQEFHCIHPERPIEFRPRLRGLRADVVLSPRRRPFGPERNWQHWPAVAAALAAAGVTFAVMGARETTVDLAGSVCHTGDLDTDAAIELLQACRLYVGNDSGGSHLAATAGAPMLVFREHRSGTRDFFPRMAAVNPDRVQVLPHGWDRPDVVIAAILDRLKMETVAICSAANYPETAGAA